MINRHNWYYVNAFLKIRRKGCIILITRNWFFLLIFFWYYFPAHHKARGGGKRKKGTKRRIRFNTLFRRRNAFSTSFLGRTSKPLEVILLFSQLQLPESENRSFLCSIFSGSSLQWITGTTAKNGIVRFMNSTSFRVHQCEDFITESDWLSWKAIWQGFGVSGIEYGWSFEIRTYSTMVCSRDTCFTRANTHLVEINDCIVLIPLIIYI